MDNQTYSIIIPATQADFTAHTYSALYSSVTASVTINGQAINLVAGSQLQIKIGSVSPTAGVYLLGENNSTYSDTVILG